MHENCSDVYIPDNRLLPEDWSSCNQHYAALGLTPQFAKTLGWLAGVDPTEEVPWRRQADAAYFILGDGKRQIERAAVAALRPFAWPIIALMVVANERYYGVEGLYRNHLEFGGRGTLDKIQTLRSGNEGQVEPISWIHAWLRKLSLDELPQLHQPYPLVGIRPLTPREVEKFSVLICGFESIYRENHVRAEALGGPEHVWGPFGYYGVWRKNLEPLPRVIADRAQMMTMNPTVAARCVLATAWGMMRGCGAW